MADEQTIRHVLTIFADADVHGALYWRIDDGVVTLFANVSDVFAWGFADLEEITADRLEELQRAYDDLAPIDNTEWVPELYAARLRSMRPQGAAYPGADQPVVRALLDTCGPERPINFSNPKAPPEAGHA